MLRSPTTTDDHTCYEVRRQRWGEPIKPDHLMNTYSVTDDPNIKCSTFIDALMVCGLATSKADARKLISGGGCYVNDVRLNKDRPISTDDFLHGKYILMRKGKKTYSMMSFNDVEQFFK